MSAAFALVHVAFRAFRGSTALGSAEVAAGAAFSPSATMTVVAFGIAALSRRPFPIASASKRQLRADVALGALTLAIFALCCALPWIAGLRHGAGEPMSPAVGLVLAACHVATAALVLGWIASDGARARPLLERAALLLAALLVAGPLAACFAGAGELAHVAFTLAWLVVAAAGEEVFFRGYVQSRLNEAFGRPWRLFGTRFGVGLVVASLFFGAIHVLNPFDVLEREGSLAWWHGLAAAAAPFGLLRERSGNLVAPFAFHLLGNLLPRIPGWLQLA